MIGYRGLDRQADYPRRPHHRAASCPPREEGAACNRSQMCTDCDSPWVLFGAMVGGPDQARIHTHTRTHTRPFSPRQASAPNAPTPATTLPGRRTAGAMTGAIGSATRWPSTITRLCPACWRGRCCARQPQPPGRVVTVGSTRRACQRPLAAAAARLGRGWRRGWGIQRRSHTGWSGASPQACAPPRLARSRLPRCAGQALRRRWRAVRPLAHSSRAPATLRLPPRHPHSRHRPRRPARRRGCHHRHRCRRRPRPRPRYRPRCPHSSPHRRRHRLFRRSHRGLLQPRLRHYFPRRLHRPPLPRYPRSRRHPLPHRKLHRLHLLRRHRPRHRRSLHPDRPCTPRCRHLGRRPRLLRRRPRRHPARAFRHRAHHRRCRRRRRRLHHRHRRTRRRHRRPLPCRSHLSWRSTRSHRHQLLRSQRAPRALRPQLPLVSRRRLAAALSSGCVAEGASRELRAWREVPAGGGENTAPCMVCLVRARWDTFRRKRRPRWHTKANETRAANDSNELDTAITELGVMHRITV